MMLIDAFCLKLLIAGEHYQLLIIKRATTIYVYIHKQIQKEVTQFISQGVIQQVVESLQTR